MGLGIPVKADVTDLCGGDQRHHIVHHAQTRTQDRHDGQLLAGQHTALGHGHGGLYLHLFGGQVPGSLVAHQACDLTHQLTEFLNAGVAAAQDSQLVLDQRMIKNMNIGHFFYLLF